MKFFRQFISFLHRQWKLASGHNEHIVYQQRQLLIHADALLRTLHRKTPHRKRRHNRRLYKAMLKRIDELEKKKV
jgi:hypothetical protein